MKFGRGIFGWILFLALAIMLFILLKNGQSTTQDVSWSNFKEDYTHGRIRSVQLNSDELVGEYNPPVAQGQAPKFRTALQPNMIDSHLLEWLTDNRGLAEVKVSNSQNLLLQVILPFIPWLLIFGFIWFFVFRQLRNSGGAGGMLGNFGRAGTRSPARNTPTSPLTMWPASKRPRKR